MQHLLKDALSKTCENLVHLTPFDVLLMCEVGFFNNIFIIFIPYIEIVELFGFLVTPKIRS